MEVILKRAYKTLGNKGDTVLVKAGYARNYLIPQGLAVVANEAHKKVALENARQATHKMLKLKANAEALLPLLTAAKVVVAAKVGEGGKIFGSVTPLQIAKSLKEQGISLDYTKITIEVPIKQIGTYQAVLALHETVAYTLTFEVVPA
ncbi:MAG: 50S ribosomal protein L9 [Candidatus Cardinium sp.]|uniref:50S ribosomal protein L9 n=1 Tax=Cardinium endosymbiont of Dermatophagoides farinae TaxID=2597823 RepID=UPI0011834F87|nr:50S ribosomal protein L9 [Cardinium endosymbiont of Dermatophagoides farinae]TSJ81341.1 50S ribosomal protein L9 [Cardinium endosymbiont of Dermatophagoides farinae]UWW97404.1 MAG: 50S ribosomal protein L9 [Candidatus Cardinium sp.]